MITAGLGRGGSSGGGAGGEADRPHLVLDTGCCSGDQSLFPRVLPALRPASGVSAAMIQNVGNQLRRVCRVVGAADWRQTGGGWRLGILKEN